MALAPIQKATLADVDAVTACVRAAYQPHVANLAGDEPGPLHDDYATYIRDHHVFIIRDSDHVQVVGLLVLIEKSGHVLLDNIAVRPEAQGHGMGKRLMALAHAEIARLGYHHIQIYTHQQMAENIAWYERCGFEVFDHRFERGLPRVYMHKTLPKAAVSDKAHLISYAPLYALLAELFARPVDTELMPLIHEVESLAPYAHDESAEEHSWLFGFQVYPYASIFLDPSGMLSSDWTGFVTGFYRALGLSVDHQAGFAAVDHISAQLAGLGELTERYAQPEPQAQQRALHAQRTMLTEHVLPWLVCFYHGVARTDALFYTAVADLALKLTLEHAQLLLEETPVPTFKFPESDAPVPTMPRSSKQKNSGEAEAQLQLWLTPARSGLFLSRHDISQLGQDLGLPVRFAERRFMLSQLITSATDSGQLASLFEGLSACAKEQHRYYAMPQTTLAPLWQSWQQRLQKTHDEFINLAADV